MGHQAISSVQIHAFDEYPWPTFPYDREHRSHLKWLSINISQNRNVGRKLARTELPLMPLNAGADLAAERGMRIPVDTVHQVKGESIDAVLYVAARPHIQSMLDGVQTELGRIGYVAVTRARNLVWLGVPSNALPALRPALLAAGFREAGGRQA